MHDILIVGAGYAGIWAGLGAARAFEEAGGARRIGLVAPNPSLTARPRLYERDLAEGDAQIPLLPLFDAAGIEWIKGIVDGVDAAGRAVTLRDGTRLEAKALVLAAGSRAAKPPVPGLAEHGEGIDDAPQAARLWRRLATLEDRKGAVAVIGGGFTGIELALELSGWRDAKAPGIEILLVDKGPIAAGYGGAARTVILDALSRQRVTSRPGTAVAAVASNHLALADGGTIVADIAVWTGGLSPSPLTRAFGGPKDALGRIRVDRALRVEGAPGWFAAGDVAAAVVDGGALTTMSCQHALSSGAFAGHNAARMVLGEAPIDYTPRPYVTCLDLGPAGAMLTRGYGRELALQGAEAKALKTSINRQLIVPPTAGGRAALLDAAAPERWMTR